MFLSPRKQTRHPKSEKNQKTFLISCIVENGQDLKGEPLRCSPAGSLSSSVLYIFTLFCGKFCFVSDNNKAASEIGKKHKTLQFPVLSRTVKI